MKKLITPLLLLALTLAAAPPISPTLTVTCTASSTTATTCSGPTYDVSGLDPTVSYQIDGSGPAGTLTQAIPSGSSTFYLATNGLVPTGSYTFELHAIGKKGTETNKVLASDSPTFPN